MAPNIAKASDPMLAPEEHTSLASAGAGEELGITDSKDKSLPKPGSIAWRSVIFFIWIHLLSVLGLIRAVTSAHWATLLFGIACYIIGGLGVTAGVHRLWSHKSYSARLPLRILLMLMYTMAGQNHIYEWVRDHRLHHRHSETDADPHNARRGFFFAHMGWLVMRKHPMVRIEGAKTDMSDMLADKVVMFNKKYYLPLSITLCFVLPTVIPMYFWGESAMDAYLIAVLKYALTLHCTWLVNSAAHLWGMHPYDKHIRPAENRYVALSAFGEGWHNYHHTFPWDYKTAELPTYGANLTKLFIDAFAKIGQAHSLKTVNSEVIQRRAARNGDGSYIAPQ